METWFAYHANLERISPSSRGARAAAFIGVMRDHDFSERPGSRPGEKQIVRDERYSSRQASLQITIAAQRRWKYSAG